MAGSMSALQRVNPSANQGRLTRYQYTQLHMGVQVRVTLYAPDRDIAEEAAKAAFDRFAELEDIMSDYRPTSELMRLCARAGGPPVPISRELYSVLARSQEVARKSGGAFDVTVGPLIQLWRAARKSGKLPSNDEITRAKALSGWRNLILSPKGKERTAQLIVPGMRLDLGGIAKGYAGDEALAAMKRRGVGRAMVEAGGDIVVSGPPPGRKGWRIIVPEGRSSTGEPPVFELANGALSTSGDTSQYLEVDGKRYSHIVDPRTGLGLIDQTTVTVIARDGITSDSLTKVVSVLGKKGLPIVLSYRGARAYIWVRDGLLPSPSPHDPPPRTTSLLLLLTDRSLLLAH
jgi:FAD:protein FMN transferase